MGIAFEAEASERSIADFTKALATFQKATQRDMRDAIRIATIDLCKSLRKQTRKAPKLLPRSAFRMGRTDPQYLTTKAYGLQRRMVRKGFAPKKDLVFWQKVRQVYKRRKLKNGGIAESWSNQSDAQLIRDARDEWGKVWNWGLAKQTWGWFMWRLFNIPDAGGLNNPRNKITGRHVEGGIIETREPLPDGTIDLQAPIKCDVTIINKLRYIRKALAPGALTQAIEQARKNLLYKAQHCLKSHRFD